MKKFLEPEIEVVEFATEDILTASGDTEQEIPAMIGDNCVS